MIAVMYAGQKSSSMFYYRSGGHKRRNATHVTSGGLQKYQFRLVRRQLHGQRNADIDLSTSLFLNINKLRQQSSVIVVKLKENSAVKTQFLLLMYRCASSAADVYLRIALHKSGDIANLQLIRCCIQHEKKIDIVIHTSQRSAVFRNDWSSWHNLIASLFFLVSRFQRFYCPIFTKIYIKQIMLEVFIHFDLLAAYFSLPYPDKLLETSKCGNGLATFYIIWFPVSALKTLCHVHS